MRLTECAHTRYASQERYVGPYNQTTAPPTTTVINKQTIRLISIRFKISISASKKKSWFNLRKFADQKVNMKKNTREEKISEVQNGVDLKFRKCKELSYVQGKLSARVCSTSLWCANRINGSNQMLDVSHTTLTNRKIKKCDHRMKYRADEWT